MNRKSQATIVLILMTVGTILTVTSTTFTGKIIHNGFLAAMIGGLADWFAVTAIFKKPLGISWRTAILPRNRQRIMSEIISFISDDLLNTKNIMKDAIKIDMAQMFIVYLNRLGGKRLLKKAAVPILEDLLQNSQQLLTSIDKIINTKEHNYLLKDLYVEIIPYLFSKDMREKLLEAIDLLTDKLIDDEKITEILLPVVHDIKDAYKKGSTFREMVIAMFDLSDESIIVALKKVLRDKLALLRDVDSEEAQMFFKWLSDTMFGLSTSEKYNAVFKNIEDGLRQKMSLTNILSGYLYSSEAKDDNTEFIEKKIDGFLTAFSNDVMAQRSFDSWLKRKLSAFVSSSSPYILQIINNKLNSYSTESFINLVENHVGSDLQMIRINGSLIGGITGMLLYALTYFTERMFS